ncbi:uncharacterized protein F4822DRAFT_298123 [Hypoxylon trugodes]|uniref:uncharacterized protein n=1 Tax=Hypoxylon trugodes TaxID=326681 RepID=UPI0021A1CBF6|nr:uncharacterized protein F4822DRAFT_298123 [Hypoxylon trugodes]KAI1387976.1 hypothetical protein F4822DRAFT_298123 [Hypoxylon trugodes]
MDVNNNNNRTSERRKRPRPQHEDTPHAACDQCRSRKVKCDRVQPECSNCRKTGVSCTSLNTPKRVNQTKQLRNDFSSVLERLDGVDQTLSALTQLTQQIAARTYVPTPRPNAHTSCSTESARTSAFSDYSSIIPSLQKDRSTIAVEDGCLHETVELEHGGERIYPYPAALALIKSLSRQLAQVLVERENEKDGEADIIVKNPALRAALRQQLESFPYSQCSQPVVTSDHRPITTPPRFLVDLFIHGFLRDFNSYTPIFDEADLRHATEIHYSDRSLSENNAWTLIFNNIVLLGLGLEAQVARAGHSDSMNMNYDMIPSFVRNCNRALADLESFTRPSLANVQALLTLALVTRHFYNSSIFERVCQTACQVGRILGLHRSVARESSAGEISTERVRLFRVLYALDKQRVFMSGQPSDLHLFDSYLILKPNDEYGSSSHRLNDGFNRMMEIWEEVYLALYSSRAIAGGKAHRSQQVHRLCQLLEEWHQQHHEFMNTHSLGVESGYMQLELKYCYHVTQVLILLHDHQNELAQRKLHDHSRTCLRLISEAGSTPPTTTSLALLARMLGNYPITAFLDLISFHFNILSKNGPSDENFESDLSMLLITSHYLRTLGHPDFPAVYFGRLDIGLTWALGLLEIVKIKPPGQHTITGIIHQQQPDISWTPPITSCPDFSFTPTFLDGRPGLELYPITDHIDFNPSIDSFERLFTPK